MTMTDRGVPNRGTNEGDLDAWNRALRSSDVYLDFMRRYGKPLDGRVSLSRGEQAALEDTLAAAGFPIPSGMHIDQGGNLNQKNRLGRNAAITAGVAGATLATMGAAGAFGGAAAAGATGGSSAVLPATATATGFAPFAGTAATPLLAGGGGFAAGGGLAAGAAGASRMSDLMRYGVPAATTLATGYMANRASNTASTSALDAQQRQFDATQAWLREQDDRRHQEYLDTETEKKRQFDALEADKQRIWDEHAPLRSARTGALTRMSDLMDRGPERYTYTPSFYYKP